MRLLRANRHSTKQRGGIYYPLPLQQVYTLASHAHSPSCLLGGDDNHIMPEHVSESSSDEHMTEYDATKMHENHVAQDGFCHLFTRTIDLEKQVVGLTENISRMSDLFN